MGNSTDKNRANKKFNKEIRSGTAALALLGVLSQAKEPMYGYQIAKLIEASGNDAPMIKQGALYPVLRSLESSGLLESQVEPSTTGPPRRYYRITQSGREALAEWTKIWVQTKDFVDAALKGARND
ncbi:MAG: PadR family transcriptional regulator [Anaerolineales bacterium]|nr:PadR family transcriptional regulator [Anaerolineales bacterium]